MVARAAPAPVPTPTAPTTAAAAPEPDRSSPKAAAVSLFNAITAGDRDAVADSFYADTDERRALATAMADVVVSGKK
ncbi:MAG: hypothetical protein QOE14_547, partial [Humisphaera sp.]|nr:hypothetical protein [Humisphaera sp.]